MRVYSHSYWLVIFVQPIAAECWRGTGGKLSRKKTTIINEPPVYPWWCLRETLKCKCTISMYLGVRSKAILFFFSQITCLLKLSRHLFMQSFLPRPGIDSAILSQRSGVELNRINLKCFITLASRIEIAS